MIALLKFWREGLIVLLLGVAALAYRSKLAAERERGRAEERSRVADSTLKAITPQLVRVDTQYVHDVKIQTRILATVDTLRDSLIAHIHDTAYVIRYIAGTDSAAKVCREVTNDCAEYKRLTTIQINALNAKLAAQPATLNTKHWYSDRISIGPYAGIDVHGKASVGVSGQLSLVRFP